MKSKLISATRLRRVLHRLNVDHVSSNHVWLHDNASCRLVCLALSTDKISVVAPVWYDGKHWFTRAQALAAVKACTQ